MNQVFLLVQGVLLALLYLPVNLAVTVIAWLLAPVLPLFASEDGWLPSWLWWFQTPDNSIDGDGTFNKPPRIQSLRECRNTGGACSG